MTMVNKDAEGFDDYLDPDYMIISSNSKSLEIFNNPWQININPEYQAEYSKEDEPEVQIDYMKAVRDMCK